GKRHCLVLTQLEHWGNPLVLDPYSNFTQAVEHGSKLRNLFRAGRALVPFDRFPPAPLLPAAIEPKRPQPSRRLRAFLMPGQPPIHLSKKSLLKGNIARQAEAEPPAEVCRQPKINGLKQCEDEGHEENHNEDEEQNSRHAGRSRRHAAKAEHACHQSNDREDERPSKHATLLCWTAGFQGPARPNAPRTRGLPIPFRRT